MEQPQFGKPSFYFSLFVYLIICFLAAFLLFSFLNSSRADYLITKVTYSVPNKIKPDSEIIINFDRSVIPEIVEKSFKITPKVEGKLLWNKDRTKAKFTPKTIMEPGERHMIAFKGKSEVMIPFSSFYEFTVEQDPQVTKFSPLKEQGVQLDEKIFINFDQSTQDYKLDFKVGIPQPQEEKQEVEEETPTTEETEEIDPEVNFDQQEEKTMDSKLLKEKIYRPEVASSSQEGSVPLAEIVKFGISWDEEKKNVVLKPEQPLKLNKKYSVEVFSMYKTEKKGARIQKIKSFSFSTLEPLHLIKSHPVGGVKDVLTTQKFTLTFDKAFDQESLRESLDVLPPTPYHLEFSQTKDNVAFFKPEKFKQDTNYKILIKAGLKAKDGSYLEEDKGIEFKTGNLGGYVNDGRLSTDDPQIKQGKVIDINLSSQLMTIFYEGTPLGTYRISSGRRGMNTPTGTYRVMRKERRHWSRQYSLWMPYSMQFTGAGHFIHELPEWTNGYKEGANHLGIPVSHGCIRLGVGPAETVFNFAEVATPITIHY
ncbi:MAG: L,D-transpeptidase family protein [Candidatus Moranbacteria bacterium]|nr:L,D-transpeptidase family protein [Candidatus Moranbacteria bacterium]